MTELEEDHPPTLSSPTPKSKVQFSIFGGNFQKNFPPLDFLDGLFPLLPPCGLRRRHVSKTGTGTKKCEVGRLERENKSGGGGGERGGLISGKFKWSDEKKLEGRAEGDKTGFRVGERGRERL